MNVIDSFLSGFKQNSEWVEWKHMSIGKSHCETCLSLDHCWFAKKNMPQLPQHAYCHCTTYSLSADTVRDKSVAQAAFSKFNPYLFDVNQEYGHGKNKLFEAWGFHVEDSTYLKKEIEHQALQKYVAGEYSLGKIDRHGQRISIKVTLKRKNQNQAVSFVTGWIVCPSGQIRLTTPLGGKGYV